MLNIIKKLVPSWVKKALTQLIQNTPSAKKKKLIQKIQKEEQCKKIYKMVNDIYGSQELSVLNGPFKGMRYIDASNGSQLLPKLVGSYEEPIHKWVYEIIQKGEYTTIIDVGCAEGYYAVGLALATKSKPRILAFDIDKYALENAKRLAEINGVSGTIYFNDKFNSSIVDKIYGANPKTKTLVFMDVEGAELDLLNTIKDPAILRCDVLVELHDCFFPGVTEKIIEYFQKSHYLEIVVDYPWRANNYFLNGKDFNKENEQFLFDEKRPMAMRWMYAKAK